jgi:ADP-heptose:LPS heptosyltransferase
MNILFIGPTRIGDTILASSIINFLIDQNKQSKFTVVTSPFSKDLYEKLPNLEKIIVINKKKYGLHWLNIWQSCIFKKWDLVVDLRSSITAYLLITKSRKIFKGNDNSHKIIQFTDFLKTSKKISPFIWSDSNDETESINKIKAEGPFIAVAPYSNWRQKDWSIEKYLELFKNDFFKSYTLIFTGISKDIPNMEKFNKLMNDPSLSIINLLNFSIFGISFDIPVNIRV